MPGPRNLVEVHGTDSIICRAMSWIGSERGLHPSIHHCQHEECYEAHTPAPAMRQDIVSFLEWKHTMRNLSVYECVPYARINPGPLIHSAPQSSPTLSQLGHREQLTKKEYSASHELQIQLLRHHPPSLQEAELSIGHIRITKGVKD